MDIDSASFVRFLTFSVCQKHHGKSTQLSLCGASNPRYPRTGKSISRLDAAALTRDT
jgi:hypothetical protein